MYEGNGPPQRPKVREHKKVVAVEFELNNMTTIVFERNPCGSGSVCITVMDDNKVVSSGTLNSEEFARLLESLPKMV